MINLTVFACVLFVVVFSGILYWTFRKGSKAFYDKIGNIPLEEDLQQKGKIVT